MKTNGGVEVENVLVLTNCVIIHQIVLMDQVKSTQYKKVASNALWLKITIKKCGL